VEDDNGRHFYVRGTVSERPSVCDMDKPLMTSLIRRELPKMDAEEFEELDDLSRGKLPQDSVTGNPGFHLHLQANCVICWSAHPADIPGQSRQVVGSFKGINVLVESGGDNPDARRWLEAVGRHSHGPEDASQVQEGGTARGKTAATAA
jgi:hypothetical protein